MEANTGLSESVAAQVNVEGYTAMLKYIDGLLMLKPERRMEQALGVLPSNPYSFESQPVHNLAWISGAVGALAGEIEKRMNEG